MQQPELSSLQHSLCILAKGLGRLLCWWWLAELMVHLMYMHALYGSIRLLETVSCWTLGNGGNCQHLTCGSSLMWLMRKGRAT